MDYAQNTLKDPNAIKRWVHRQRLVAAIDLIEPGRHQQICDFGAGDGETSKWVAQRFPDAHIVCFEPAPSLFAQALVNLAGRQRIRLVSEPDAIADDSIDTVLCLEVLEHLPPAESAQALSRIHRMLKVGGRAIFGLPNEVGLPALYKGLFRMSRRYGDYDATVRNVVSSTFGYPPRDRPVEEIGPGLRFHYFHTGFDYRAFELELGRHLEPVARSSSPLPWLGVPLNPEVYFVARKRESEYAAGPVH